MMAPPLLGAVILTVIFACFVSVTAYNGSQWLQEISSIYCPHRHHCNDLISRTDEEHHNTSCCAECSCEDDCVDHGNCCPFKENIPNKIPVLQCKTALTKSYSTDNRIYNGRNFGIERFRIIDDCPTEEKNETLVQQCKGETNTTALEDYVWVSDQVTGNVYQNKHCATCHGIQKYTPWRISTPCEEVLMTETRNIPDTILSSEKCLIVNEPPSRKAVRVEPARCYIPEYEKCNVTGLWKSYDSEIERACMQIDWTYFAYQVLDYGQSYSAIYKNLFCYICNNDADPLSKNERCDEGGQYRGGGQGSSFAVVLDFGQLIGDPSAADTMSECAANEVLDIYTKLCRRLICPFGQAPNYGKCTSIALRTNGLGVEVSFNLTVISEQSTLQLSDFSLEDFESFAKTIYRKMRSSLGLNPSKCDYCQAMADIEDGNFRDIYLDIFINTTPECQLNLIIEKCTSLFGKFINIKIGKRDNILFRIGLGKIYKMFPVPGFTHIPVLNSRSLCTASFQLNKEIYCPKVNLSIWEHELIYNPKQRSIFLSFFDKHESDQQNTTECLDKYLLAMSKSGYYRQGIGRSMIVSILYVLNTVWTGLNPLL